MKTPARILAIFIIIIMVVIAVIYFKGSEVISNIIDDSSQSYTQTDIQIDDIALNPFNGIVGVMGFAMGQPTGFGSGKSFSVNELMVDVKLISLFDEHMVVETILIDKPVINIVLIGNESNFGTIYGNMDVAQNPDDPPINMSVQDFYLNGAKLMVSSDKFGEHELTLEDIHLTNIGVEEGGVPPKEVFRHAMDAIKPQLGKFLVELGIKNQLTQEFDDNIGNQLNQQLEKLPEPVKDVIDMFKPKKKDE